MHGLGIRSLWLPTQATMQGGTWQPLSASMLKSESFNMFHWGNGMVNAMEKNEVAMETQSM